MRLRAPDNVALGVLLVGVVLAKLVVYERSIDASRTALLSDGHILSVNLGESEVDLAGLEHRVELSRNLKAYLLVARGAVPEGTANIVDIHSAGAHIERGSELIAVAHIVPVARGGIVKSVALLIVIDKLGLVDKERMDVAEEVARVIYLYADLNACDTHIRKGVVAGVDKQTDRAGLAVSYDVYGVYITVGRAVVNAVLDVKTDLM